jgi:hypothetical protein
MLLNFSFAHLPSFFLNPGYNEKKKLGSANSNKPRQHSSYASPSPATNYDRQRFERSMQLLQRCAKDVSEVRVTSPGESKLPEMEDYTLIMYRKTVDNFEDRVKDLESKLFFPVRRGFLSLARSLWSLLVALLCLAVFWCVCVASVGKV